MSYDPHERRDTPLALALKERIDHDGPLTVAEFMRACLYDSAHGYYVRQPAIGAGGDFVTAPEISQMFGELIGLWCAVVWQQMGRPTPFDLVEYGPGRGTMMADALRALARVPDCLKAARVRLVEVSPALRRIQQEKLNGASAAVSWHTSLAGEIDPAPAIVLANEVLDADIVRQLVFVGDEIRGERCVGLDGNGALQFCVRRTSGEITPDHGEVLEERELHRLVSHDLAALPRFAALLIDYGHVATARGDTLQAVRAHRAEHPLTSPGEADLTAQVDFAALARQCRQIELAVDGPITQAELLGALGIGERASRLMAANPSLASGIEADAARLMSPTGMGTRFKALGLRSPDVPLLPGFPALTAA